MSIDIERLPLWMVSHYYPELVNDPPSSAHGA